MGMMQRIRSLPTIIVTGVIFLFLLLMILPSNMDEFSSRKGDGANAVVGEINGEKILRKDFEELVNEQAEDMRMQQQGREEDIDMELVRDRVWNTLVNKILIRQEAAKAGITVGKEEVLDAMLGGDIPPQIQQALGNIWTDQKTGRPDLQKYLTFITDPDAFIDGSNVPEENRAKVKSDIHKLIKKTEDELLLQKVYSSLSFIGGGAAIPPPLAVHRRYVVDSSSVSFDYVYVDASRVSDKDVPVNDQEISDYYNSHKQYYKQKAGRKVKYVVFPIVPSKEDSAAVNKKVNAVATVLSQGTDIASRDSLFTVALATNTGRVGEFIPDSILSTSAPQIKALLDSIQPHQVIGPTFIKDAYTFLRLDERKVVSDTTVKLSHIMMRIGEGINEDTAKAQLQRAIDRVKAGEDFAAVARAVSQEEGTASKGGDLGEFTSAKLTNPDIKKAIANIEINGVSDMVKLPDGYHFFKLTDRKIANTPSTRYSDVSFSYNVSNMTKKNIQSQAAKLAEQVKSGVMIDSAAVQYKLRSIETSYFDRFQNIMNTPQVNLFAYQAKLNEVSEPMELTRYGYTVVQISAIREAGTAALDEELKNNIRTKLMNRKRLDVVKAKAESIASQIASAGTFDVVRNIDTTLQVKTAMNAKDNGMLPGSQTPPDNVLTATAMKMEAGKFSGAIRGEVGYYIIKVTQKTVADESKFAANYDAFAKSMTQQISQPLIGGWYTSIRDKADITDNRYKMFYKQ